MADEVTRVLPNLRVWNVAISCLSLVFAAFDFGTDVLFYISIPGVDGMEVYERLFLATLILSSMFCLVMELGAVLYVAYCNVRHGPFQLSPAIRVWIKIMGAVFEDLPSSSILLATLLQKP